MYARPLIVLPVALLLLLVAQAPLFADKPNESGSATNLELQTLAQAQHTTSVGNEQLAYTAAVGALNLKDAKDETRASIYYYAYTRNHVDDMARRPITFAFNGGPGSASVWLHLGLMGPKRVPMPDDATLPQPPYALVDNPYSLLDVTDIVMIDPVSTGISRQAKGVDAKQFHGYNEDIESVASFIDRFVTLHNRWKSPKFLLGESYGTTRAAGLAGRLQNQHGMYLNGIAMVSSVLDFQTLRFHDGNDLPYVLFLPSYTATAWYHGRLEAGLQKDLKQTLAEVERFALDEYSVALLKGARLTAGERRRTAEKLARYTGLSPAYWQQANLRVTMPRFSKELLRAQRRTIGRLDSRYKGIDRDVAGGEYSYDPSNSAIMGPYTASLNDYLRNHLQYKLGRRYHIFGAVHPWNYSNFTGRYVDASETLRKAMSGNPSLKIFVASGYMDLATPYFASDYTYNQLQLEPALQKNISMAYYEAGHMMYVHEPSLRKLKHDLVQFYGSAQSSSAER